MYLFVHICQQSRICDNGIWYLQVQVQVQPLLSPTHHFLMSLFHKLRTSCASTSSNADLISTPATVRSMTQSGSILRRRRDSNDFDYGLDDVITRPAGTFPITPGTKKRLKSSCDDIACHNDVDADDLKCFAEVRSILSWVVPLIYVFSPRPSFTLNVLESTCVSFVGQRGGLC